MISVIMPAHNEESVIGRSLLALTQGASPGELEIVVVCNGCTDQTAQAARGFAPIVRVIETPVASKVHALNLGEALATGFPRFYIDADVVLPLAALRRLAERLDRGDVLAVAPRFRMELAGCSWSVRAFYDINDRLPTSGEGIGGSGVYGLSQAGRGRFGSFPDVVADDGFVRVQFAPHERATLAECHSTVFAPRVLRDLVCIKTRSHLGLMQLRLRVPELWRNRGATNRCVLERLVWCPWLWPKLAVYGYVKIMARWRAHRRLRRADYRWERAASARTCRAM